MRSFNSVIGHRTYYDNGHIFDSILKGERPLWTLF